MTDNAGYCMAVTAKRDGMRLLAIVLGEKEGKVRNKETMELLDYGFNLCEIETIKNKGDIVGEIKIDKGEPNKIDVMVGNDINILRKKTDNKKEYISEVKLDNVKLPIRNGDIIGKLLVKDGSNTIKTVNLISSSMMKKKSFLSLWFNLLKAILTGSITS